MFGRRVSVAAVAVAVLLLAGCVPEPQPTPTPTGFASDEEAFRAAEATYRAYVDALNDVDLADPATFEPVFAWLTGDALESSRQSFSQMHADALTVSGESRADRIERREVDPPSVTLDVCLDVTEVDVLDDTGRSIVPDSRLNRQPIQATFRPAATPTGLKISKSEAIESTVCG